MGSGGSGEEGGHDLESLGRTALRVYIRILESGKPLGVRDLSRALGIPVSTVHYHLKRLEDMGLVKRSGEGYTVSRIARLEGYVILGRTLIPRLTIYSTFFLGILAGQILRTALGTPLNPDSLLAIIASAAGFLVLFAEGLRLRRGLAGSRARA